MSNQVTEKKVNPDREYTEERSDFYRTVPDWNFGSQRVAISSPDVDNEDSGIRLYCTTYRARWSLQIRGFFQTRNYKKGAKWYLADADLCVEDVRALRDACDAALSGLEGGQ